ncbi:MAG: PDZ domain-containing protein, partial [Gammaproteobacteria bacterium]|nr:PDZ domain-containing protein [Gammaproteobacteria bacterium]
MKILAIFGCVTVLALVSPVHAQTASSAQSPAAAQQQAAQQQRKAVQQQQLARDQEKMQRDQQKLEQDQQALERDQQGMAQHQQLLEMDQQQLERQMQQARREMQQAAQRMAQLSMQMQGPMLARLSRMFDPNRAVLGISIADSRDSQDTARVRVEAVTPGGPADQAGLRAGDTITAINGVRFQSTAKQSAADQLMNYMDKVKPGDSLKLAYLRDGQAHAVTLKAGRLADYSFAFTLPPLPPVP